jgi:uncharacterized protein (DUF1697 family)
MATFIVMLRGVNVGGNILKMDRLREVCEELGFKNVETYVQSGNIVFDSDRSAASLVTLIEKHLAGECRLAPSVIVRTPAEFRKIIAGNPFLKVKDIDPTRLYVTFLAAGASKDASGKLSGIKAGGDRFHLAGKEIYLHCPVSYGETKLSNNAIQKTLGVTATTRNWKTVNTLLEMAANRPLR